MGISDRGYLHIGEVSQQGKKLFIQKSAQVIRTKDHHRHPDPNLVLIKRTGIGAGDFEFEVATSLQANSQIKRIKSAIIPEAEEEKYIILTKFWHDLEDEWPDDSVPSQPSLEELNDELNSAVKKEDYLRAARFRDAIKRR